MKKTLCLLSTLLLLCACATKTPPIISYTLDTGDTGNQAAPKGRAVLLVLPTTSVPQFSSLLFSYRVNERNYRHDYYHRFMNSPNQEVNQAIRNRLRQAHLKTYVSASGSLIQANYVLQSTITELYADYRAPDYPVATISIHCKLYQTGSDGTQLIFDKSFAADAPIHPNDASGLVDAWNRSLATITQQLIEKLRSYS
jgi:ABC-type uncharacterized transport system auxiliary subunit